MKKIKIYLLNIYIEIPKKERSKNKTILINTMIFKNECN